MVTNIIISKKADSHFQAGQILIANLNRLPPVSKTESYVFHVEKILTRTYSTMGG
jgi:hypothetical protein